MPEVVYPDRHCFRASKGNLSILVSGQCAAAVCDQANQLRVDVQKYSIDTQ